MSSKCVKCHFFIRERDSYKLDVNIDNRLKAQQGDFSWVYSDESLACYFGVWDEGYARVDRFKVISQTQRKDYCFFWQHRPGMLLTAAEILQRRESESKEARIERRLTLWGLWIAALALFTDVILRLLKY